MNNLIILSIYGEYIEGALQPIQSIEHHESYFIVTLRNGETHTINSNDRFYKNLLENDYLYLLESKDILLEKAGNLKPYKKAPYIPW